MHDAKVHMKNGQFYCGPIWDWRPKDGWFSVVGENEPIKIKFVDVKEAYDNDRTDVTGRIEKCDLLERARKDGWEG